MVRYNAIKNTIGEKQGMTKCRTTHKYEFLCDDRRFTPRLSDSDLKMYLLVMEYHGYRIIQWRQFCPCKGVDIFLETDLIK